MDPGIQRVIVNGCSSDWYPVSSRVPQGSILGPCCSCFMFNYIGAHLKSRIRPFADDCTIIREIAGREDCEVLQSDLHELYQWTYASGNSSLVPRRGRGESAWFKVQSSFITRPTRVWPTYKFNTKHKVVRQAR